MRAWLPFSLCKRNNFRFRRPDFGYCSQPERQNVDSPTLKGELRRLFKLIHPDLFHNLPVEQATNQHSFQLLQEYLNAAKGASTCRQLPYHFVFFIREDVNAGNLRKVQVSLPPPQIRYHGQQITDILPATRRSISRLLLACGLSGDVSGGLTSEEDHVRLSELFQQASEIQRHNEVSATDLERQLGITKNALSLGRGIRASVRPPVSELSSRDQLEALERLATALDNCKEVNLSGHTLLIGDCYGVDALGNLWLKYKDNIQSWSNFFQVADLKKAIENQREASLRRVLEIKAARLMEVEMIFTHDALAIHPDYSYFLNNVAKEATNYGAVGAGKFSQLPIRVTCPKRGLEIDFAGNAASNAMPHMNVDQTFGYITVPVWEGLQNVYKYIEERGEEALQVRERLKQSEKHREQVKLVVRKKLRLRQLTFDRKLQNEMCIAACLRLIHFAPELEKYMEGLSVCISDEHRLPIEDTKSSLHLKWNFSLSEL